MITKRHFQSILSICLLFSLVAGCSVAQHKPQSRAAAAAPPGNGSSGGSAGSGGAFADEAFPVRVSYSRSEIADLIKHEFKFWRGTRHRMGGNGRRGFDCSGFSNHIFETTFGVGLPRTTTDQVRVGYRIKRAQLRPGDLVFFKPHSYPRHVGVYVGNGQFVHASSSKGVIVSRLDSGYWKKHYWTSRRVIVAQNEV